MPRKVRISRRLILTLFPLSISSGWEANWSITQIRNKSACHTERAGIQEMSPICQKLCPFISTLSHSIAMEMGVPTIWRIFSCQNNNNIIIIIRNSVNFSIHWTCYATNSITVSIRVLGLRKGDVNHQPTILYLLIFARWICSKNLAFCKFPLPFQSTALLIHFCTLQQHSIWLYLCVSILRVALCICSSCGQ